MKKRVTFFSSSPHVYYSRQLSLKRTNMKNNHGFTLIELLVVIAIIGLLIGLTLPAVQMARESARRSHCSNKLRQISLAIHSWESSHGYLPPGAENGHGFLSHILPFIEQTTVFNSINFEVPEPHSDNLQNRSIAISLFQCPSDSASANSSLRGSQPSSYVGNQGSGFQRFGDNGIFGTTLNQLTFAGISDGTSNTCMLSESLVGGPRRDVNRRIYHGPRLQEPHQLDEFAEICRNITDFDTTFESTSRGRPWTNGSVLFTLYNHIIEPNYASCTNDGNVLRGAFTASSHHPGGVNSARADGSTFFVRNSIDITTWRSLGSRNGREVH